MDPTLLVLAAGIGRRYGGLKQTEAMGPGGETIVDYSVYDAIRAGFGRLVFVIRPEIEQMFKESVAAGFDTRIEVEYAYQQLDSCTGEFPVPFNRGKPWGTAHAVLVAEKLIDGPFAAINADDFYGAAAYTLMADHLRSACDTDVADYSMVGYVLRNTLSEFGGVARGLCKCDERNMLEKIVETFGIVKDGDRAKYRDGAGRIHPLSGDEIVSMNIWGFTPSIFGHLKREFAGFLEEHGQDTDAECLIPTVVNVLVAAGEVRVKVLPSRDPWCGVTYPEDKPYVVRTIRKLVARGDYPERLWS